MTIFESFKGTGDKALSLKKNYIIELYHEWKDRPPLMFYYLAVDTILLSSSNDGAHDGNINSKEYFCIQTSKT